MEKKYQIFISSTFNDLKSARIKVRDAILSMYHFPVGMVLLMKIGGKLSRGILMRPIITSLLSGRCLVRKFLVRGSATLRRNTNTQWSRAFPC